MVAPPFWPGAHPAGPSRPRYSRDGPLWRVARLALLILLASGAAWCQEQPGGTSEQLLQEIGILRQLNALDLSRAQLEGLRKAWSEVERRRRQLAAKRDTPEIRAAAAAVRQALLESRPDEQIDTLIERLRSLLPKEDEEGDPDQQLFRLARQQARQVLNLLRAQQIVRLVGDEGPEGGPAQAMLRAVRGLRDDLENRASRIADFSARLSRELTDDDARARDSRGAIEALLVRAAELSDAAFETQRKALGDEAEQIVNRAVGSPIGVIQWQAEQRLADLLQEPRLGPVLDEKLKRLP